MESEVTKTAPSGVKKVKMVFCASSFSFIMSLMTLIVLESSFSSASTAGDSCDWSGSGLELENASKTVRPVHLRCTAGKIQWAYPRGAILVELDPFTAPPIFRKKRQSSQEDNYINDSSDNLFCLKLGVPESIPIVVYSLGPKGDVAKKLYSSGGSSGGRRPLCFRSDSGSPTSAALLIETGHVPEVLHREEINIAYHIEPDDGRPGSFSETHECRPCSPPEILEAFCTSEFVARGSIKAVSNDADGDWTSLKVAVSKLHRQATPDDTKIFSPISKKPTGLEGLVHFANNCQARPPSGALDENGWHREEFVVMGNVKLGVPIVNCAPTWKEWREAVNMAAAKRALSCRVDLN